MAISQDKESSATTRELRSYFRLVRTLSARPVESRPDQSKHITFHRQQAWTRRRCATRVTSNRRITSNRAEPNRTQPHPTEPASPSLTQPQPCMRRKRHAGARQTSMRIAGTAWRHGFVVLNNACGRPRSRLGPAGRPQACINRNCKTVPSLSERLLCPKKSRSAFSELRAWSDSASSRCSKTIRGSKWSLLPRPHTAPARLTKRPSAVAGRWKPRCRNSSRPWWSRTWPMWKTWSKTLTSCSPR